MRKKLTMCVSERLFICLFFSLVPLQVHVGEKQLIDSKREEQKKTDRQADNRIKSNSGEHEEQEEVEGAIWAHSTITWPKDADDDDDNNNFSRCSRISVCE